MTSFAVQINQVEEQKERTVLEVGKWYAFLDCGDLVLLHKYNSCDLLILRDDDVFIRTNNDDKYNNLADLIELKPGAKVIVTITDD